MKLVKLLGILVVCGLFQTAWAADCQVTLSWDGMDSAGNTEQSLPVTFAVFNADTQDVLSTAQANGAVTDYAMPSFSVVPPANTVLTLRMYATAKDSAGNESGHSEVVSVELTGDDTVGPVAPQINISITE